MKSALDVLKDFVEWNKKYPSGRAYHYSEMGCITAQLDKIAAEANAAIAKCEADFKRVEEIKDHLSHILEGSDFEMAQELIQMLTGDKQ